MPFDRFTVEQLAGDLLPEPTLEQKVAAGYNRLGMMSAEGGVQPKEYLAKYAAERVRNVGGAWLGVTLGCAECHDHKFDPFSTRDFYRMEAFFADIEERGLYDGSNFGPSMPVPTAEQSAELARLDGEIAAARDDLNRLVPSWPTPSGSGKSPSASQPNWVVLTPRGQIVGRRDLDDPRRRFGSRLGQTRRPTPTPSRRAVGRHRHGVSPRSDRRTIRSRARARAARATATSC